MAKASNRLGERIAKNTGSNQLMAFHKLFVKHPRRVTTDYYLNPLHQRGTLAIRPELANVSYTGGPILTPISQVYAE